MCDRKSEDGKPTVAGTIQGKVVEIDAQGSLVTDIDASQLSAAPRDSTVRIVVDEHETFGIFPPEHNEAAMTLIAILGAAGPLKVELVGDSAGMMLGVRAGAPVEVTW
ncbi:MAG: adenosylmethionine-8-amino-7-oxononanoate aminotransferase [Pirellulales bacterium]